MTSFRASWSALLDLLAPPRCPACDSLVEPGLEVFCQACGPLIEPRVRGPATYVYGGPLADALRRFKYGGHVEIARPLGALFAEAAHARYAGRVDHVVAIPADSGRRRARGYDPTLLLAAPVAKALGARLAPRLLVRTRGGLAQASLRRRAREQNVHGLFEAREQARGLRILLLDDVRTTGATLLEARRALALQQPTALYALAFAAVEA
ncbi:MAG: ComF family protein [Myxococcales bacterium]|nr:ComF family protein [Myxococcales bacterium]